MGTEPSFVRSEAVHLNDGIYNVQFFPYLVNDCLHVVVWIMGWGDLLMKKAGDQFVFHYKTSMTIPGLEDALSKAVRKTAFC